MGMDLTTINTALTTIALVSVVQLLLVASAAVWGYRAYRQAARAVVDEIRPALAQLSRAAGEIEQAARSVGASGESARHALSDVSHVARRVTEVTRNVAPAFAPKTFVAAQVGASLVGWFLRRRRHRKSASHREWASHGESA